MKQEIDNGLKPNLLLKQNKQQPHKTKWTHKQNDKPNTKEFTTNENLTNGIEPYALAITNENFISRLFWTIVFHTT